MSFVHGTGFSPRFWRLFEFSRKNGIRESTKENTMGKEVTRPKAVSATELEDGPKTSQTFDRPATTTFSTAVASPKSPIHTFHSEPQRTTVTIPQSTNPRLTDESASKNHTFKMKGYKNTSRVYAEGVSLVRTSIPANFKIPRNGHEMLMKILPGISSKCNANKLSDNYVEKKDDSEAFKLTFDKPFRICCTGQLSSNTFLSSTKNISTSCHEVHDATIQNKFAKAVTLLENISFNVLEKLQNSHDEKSNGNETKVQYPTLAKGFDEKQTNSSQRTTLNVTKYSICVPRNVAVNLTGTILKLSKDVTELNGICKINGKGNTSNTCVINHENGCNHSLEFLINVSKYSVNTTNEIISQEPSNTFKIPLEFFKIIKNCLKDFTVKRFKKKQQFTETTIVSEHNENNPNEKHKLEHYDLFETTSGNEIITDVKKNILLLDSKDVDEIKMTYDKPLIYKDFKSNMETLTSLSNRVKNNENERLQQICNQKKQNRLGSIQNTDSPVRIHENCSLHRKQSRRGKNSNKNQLTTQTHIYKGYEDTKKISINSLGRHRIKNVRILRMKRGRGKKKEEIKCKATIYKYTQLYKDEMDPIVQRIFPTKNINYKQASKHVIEKRYSQTSYGQRKVFSLQNGGSFSLVSYYKPKAIDRKIFVNELMHGYSHDTGLCVPLKCDSTLTYWSLKRSRQNYSTNGSTSGSSSNEISSYSRKLQKYCTSRKNAQNDKSEKENRKEEYEKEESPQERIKREFKEVEECKKVKHDNNKSK